ncbi:MAG: carbohydrate-binding protein [Moraxellaceae bacterium]|nr:MAG: carbohydrate-binding protein [Moraxellaceae bacterium]
MEKTAKILVAFTFTFFFSYLHAQTVYNPVPVQKTINNKVYVHLMPWFESKEFSGYWGGHWTMANQNPDIIDGSGRRQIASYYYPLIGPYASADPDVIEYQLLLMKLSGVDGVLIDWPGTTNAFDYVRNRQNAEALINRVAKVGLEFAIVYEDNNLTLANVGDKRGQARNDMAYMRDNYFNKPEYTKVNNQPLMLVFGPQTFQNEADWSDVFSVLPNKPYFLTLWYEHGEAGVNGKGEYSWIYQDGTPYLTHLTNFYKNATNYGMKMGAAAPGFNAFYAAGGWGSNPFVINANGTSTYQATLDLAINNNVQNIQLVTWNDYGEGTMIEPTREFGYGFLTYTQKRLGVDLAQSDLELVHELFQQRKKFKGNSTEQTRLNQVFYYLVSLQINAARNLLTGVTPAGIVNLFQHCDYTGYSAAINEGSYNLAQLNALGIANDDISSLKVQSGYQIKMYQHDNLTGNTITKSANDSCLVDDGFNDDITSVVVSKITTGGWSTRIEAESFVSMNGIAVEAASEGGQNVGWIDAGDWMVWNINLPSSGSYKVEYRVAGMNGGAIRFEKAGANPIYGTINVPNTGGWQNWQTITHTVNLTAGQQQIAIYAPAGGYNINWIQLTKQ